MSQVNRATSQTLRMQATQEGLIPLKAWVKNALDRVIRDFLDEPDLEFSWVGDDAIDPLQQAQTLVALVGAGIKTREEARAELGLAETPVAKFNPYHDEQGRFTTAESAVEPGTHRPLKPDRGIEVADNECGPTTDVGGGDPTPPSRSSETDAAARPKEIATQMTVVHEAPNDAIKYQSGDGTTFLAPPKADFNEIFLAGRANGLLGADAAIAHFGTYDFQRDGNNFYPAYTNASNYAVGVYMAGAGYSRNETVLIAAIFARAYSSNAGSPTQSDWWKRGWNDAMMHTGPFSSGQ